MLRLFRLCATRLVLVALLATGPLVAQDNDAPDVETLAEILGAEDAASVTVARVDEGVPGWTLRQGDAVLGHVGSTWEIAESVGYSGRPLEVLVGIGPDAIITGAQLIRHNEPVLTLGISDADISAYVSGFAGYDLRQAGRDDDGLPKIISRATVSTGVIRDSILRTARTLAFGRGLIQAEAGIDRLSWHDASWDDLVAMGALSEVRLSMTDAARALDGAKVAIPQGDGDFLHLWAGLADPPTVGQNLLGQQGYTAAIGALDPGEAVLIVMSRGLYSHRGTAWRRDGVFNRLTIRQGDNSHTPRAEDFNLVTRLRIEGAPELKEISLFKLPASFDPLEPLTVEVRASRPAEDGGDVATTLSTEYLLPESLRTAPPPEPEPLWRSAWRESVVHIVVVALMLIVLFAVVLAQEWLVRRASLYRVFRLSFLAVTLVVLGWGLGGQLSVVQVIAFLHSLLDGFRWETFLIEPVIFMLWSFVALGLLFWGRGIYCGWLCPFGALQELTNAAAQKLGVKQVAVPSALHERLWILKYTAFVGLVALSFYSMEKALVMAEVEPFKTAISMRFVRAWPFVLFVLAVLGAGLFIERFYCRYLCPLGAGLAIPAKLKIFDWLHRRPQCGRECRLCETKCTVGAIDNVGRINPNECVLCLRCQVMINDATTCPVLKRRQRSAA
ncbi:NosR/NirI family protein [Maritimibacter sp. DP4N28-5]|uniref:NosR/NirI family protein n=2 Tax=Maritimibacter dapengensis TaxID=2836868 RepID=A0ABS6T0Z6_9RHOB|nr:NosR/NirI family protein [Maritimibacter dapengensis]